MDDDWDIRKSPKHTVVLTNRLIKPRRRVVHLFFPLSSQGQDLSRFTSENRLDRGDKITDVSSCQKTDHTLLLEVSKSNTKTCGHFGKNKVDQEQLYQLYREEYPRISGVQRKQLCPVEPITPSTSFDHSSSQLQRQRQSQSQQQ